MDKDTLKDYKWWTLKESEGKGNQLAASVFYLTDQITKSQTRYWRNNFLFSQLYENIDSLVTSSSFPLLQSFGLSTVNSSFNSKLTFNVVKSCIDSVVAKIAKNKPRVKFVTTGGDHKLRKKATNLTKYLDGVFYESDIYNTAVKVFKDSCIFGTGCMKISYDEHSKQFVADRVIVPLEIVIDNAESQYGKPRQLHQRKLISKDILKFNFPDKVKEISGAETVPNLGQFSDDRILVIESWKLPSYKGAGDGKHCIAINNITLLDEEYEKEHFPFVFINWTDRVHGFFGYGLAEELTYMQLMITRVLKMIQAGQAIMSVPRVFAWANSVTNKSALYDAGVMELRPGAQAPIFNTAPAASADMYAYLENMVNKSYQMSGVSQMSANAVKPPGVESAVAMQELSDQSSERFSIQSSLYENMFLNIANVIIDLSRDAYKNNRSLSSKSLSSDQRLINTIEFGDANLEDSQFAMQCFPVSKLPTTPAGRLEFVVKMVQAGAINQAQMIELMEMPDIENFYSLKNATFDVVGRDLDKIVEEEEYTDPDPSLDYNIALEFSQAYYLKSLTSGASEESLEMLRNYRDAIIAMQQTSQPPAPNQPLGVPQAPPTSDLLPQQA